MMGRDMTPKERADRDAMIREWQRKSDLAYPRTPQLTGLRRIARILRNYPGSLAQDIVAVVALFGLTYVALLVTGTH